MEDYRQVLNPDDLTPEERLDQIVELLAIASIRLAAKDRASAEAVPPKNTLDSPGNSLYCSVPTEEGTGGDLNQPLDRRQE